MTRLPRENHNTQAEWDEIYGGPNAARWTIWHSDHLVGLFNRFIPVGASVVNLGSGNGWTEIELANRDRNDIKWTAVDHSEKSIAFLQKLAIPWVECRQVDLNDLPLPFADGQFDMAMCSEVLEHLEDPAGVVWEMQRIARRVAVTVPNDNATDTRWHVWSIDKADLLGWMPGARIELARSETILCAFWEGRT